MGKHKGSVDSRIQERLQSQEPGWVFTPADFYDLGSRTAVATALTRLKKAGTIRQVGRGLYDVPRHHKVLGVLSPTPEAITRAIQARSGIRLQPGGAYAANLLGLSEQVPAKIVYLTDGKAGMVKVGNMRIQLKRTTPRNMAVAGKLSGMLIQAFRNLGQKNIDRHRIEALRKKIPAQERAKILEDLPFAPIWMHRIFRELASP